MSNLDLNAPSSGELIDSAPAVRDNSKGARNIKRVRAGGYGGQEGKGAKYQGTMTEPIRQPPKTRYEMRRNLLNMDRETWRAHILDVKNLFLPYRTRWLDDGGLPNRGNKKMQYVVDNCPMLALRTMSAGLMAGMTSPSRPWFRLRTDDEELMENPGVAEWCERVTDAIHRILQKSNFYRAIPTFYEEIGAFGTAAVGIYEIPQDLRKRKPLINCQTYTWGEYWIAQDEENVVDTFMRRFKWTVQQVVKKFVENPDDPDDPTWDNLIPATVALWHSRKWDRWVDIIHVIEPNDTWEAGALGTRGMQARSVYYEMGGSPEILLGIKGFLEMPIFVARWDTNSDDVWGHSPAMYCLGDAKQLMTQQKRKMQGIDKQMDPPLIGDASLKRQTVSQLPGDVTWLEVTAATTFGLKPLYEVKPDLTAMLGDLEETRKRIRAGMYENVFQMMRTLEDTLKSGITATEINARKQEQLLELGPLLDRLNGEAFGPIIERVFNIAERRSRLAWQHVARGQPVPPAFEMFFPPPPQALQGKPLQIDYISILAQAVRVAEIQGINQTTQYVLMLAQAKPDVLDKVDFDKAIEIIADRTGTPPECIVADEVVQKIRQQRAAAQAQAQKAEQMANAAPAAASAAKSLSETPIGGSNALEQLLGGATGGA
jgi:head-to-tail connecting protein